MSRGQNTTAAALGGLRYTDGNNYGCIIKEQAEKTLDLVCLLGGERVTAKNVRICKE